MAYYAHGYGIKSNQGSIILILLILVSIACNSQPIPELKNRGLSPAELKLFSDETYASVQTKNDFIKWVAIGQALSVARAYEESNAWFERAYLLKLDQRTQDIPKNEESFDDYHEVSMLLYFKTLNYLQLGDVENAMVECRRLNEWMQPQNRTDLARKLLAEDPLIQTLMGFVYEVDHDYSDSYISYHEAEQDFEAEYKNLLSKHVPQQIINSSRQMNLLSAASEYNIAASENFPYGQLLIVWHNGQGPKKYLKGPDFKIRCDEGNLVRSSSNVNPYIDCLGNKLLPFYSLYSPNYSSCEVLQDSTHIHCELLEDVSWYSIHTLQERLNSNGIHVWHHGINWSTLPANIFYAVVPLHAGSNHFEFKAFGAGSTSKTKSFTVEGDGRNQAYVISTLDSNPLVIPGRGIGRSEISWSIPQGSPLLEIQNR